MITDNRGFTLIEVLVAMAVVALIALSLSGALRFGVQAWRAGAQSANAAERVITVQDFLRRQINASMMKPRFGHGENPPALIDGASNRFEFSSLISGNLGSGGFYRFEIFLDENRLMLRWTPYNAGILLQNDAARRTFVLLEGVEGVKFSYAENVGLGGEIEWLSVWKDIKQLPKLVRLKMSFLGDDGLFWPTFVAKTYVEELKS